ncbi:hypothetical protein [Rubripirellula reticaptiva]|uniref:hypothetical protein n=1 Tax=Rubripirellula reticaptiva TaxID=2528013 RepID=UPI0011B3E909|nr:hypothetical protein [Rubripirellula reticaptiva]
MLASGTPGTLAGVDLDATVGKDASYQGFEAVDVVVNAIATLDESELFTNPRLGYVDRQESPQHGHLGELEGIVAVGLSLGGFSVPGLFVGAGDECFDLSFLADVIEQAQRYAGFHDNQVDVRPRRQQVLNVGSFGGDRLELVLLSGRVREAADAINLAKVDGACHHKKSPWFGFQRVRSDCL